jgi:RNA recognition motif-containing protein
MNKKLYVGNLSYEAQDADVKDLFSQFGTVESVKLIVDHNTGRAKGFGFVEMSQSEEADNAQKSLDGQDFLGRTLKVNPAKDKEKRERKGPRDRY